MNAAGEQYQCRQRSPLSVRFTLCKPRGSARCHLAPRTRNYRGTNSHRVSPTAHKIANNFGVRHIHLNDHTRRAFYITVIFGYQICSQSLLAVRMGIIVLSK